jgi:nitrogen PTS system EIIA component
MTAAAAGFADLVAAICLDLGAISKEALFEQLCATAAAKTGIDASVILERVGEREALGCTGFGNGAAIPHARLGGLARVTCVVARLAKPVDYRALDGEPVDIAVLLLSPEGAGADHLKALARISRALRSPATLAEMRAASDEATLRLAIGGLAQAA